MAMAGAAGAVQFLDVPAEHAETLGRWMQQARGPSGAGGDQGEAAPGPRKVLGQGWALQGRLPTLRQGHDVLDQFGA
jgi:hypothetical protein